MAHMMSPASNELITFVEILPGNWHVILVHVLQFYLLSMLTHWGRVMHICVGKWTIIGSDNGLSPGRRQAIIWTNAGILLIWPLETNFSEILIRIQTFSFKKIYLKMSSAKCRPFCLGLNVLNKQRVLMHRHQGWNVRHGLCHIYMRYLYIYEMFIAFVCFVVCSLL